MDSRQFNFFVIFIYRNTKFRIESSASYSKIAEANRVNQLICDVDQELKEVTRKMLEYKSVDYSLDYILYQQDELHEKYKEKTKNIGIDIC